MSRVSFNVFGEPVGQARPRFARIGAGVRTYTPKATAEWVKRVKVDAEHALQFAPEFDTEAPMDVVLVFFMPIPASWPKWKREAAARGQVAHTSKPDADNLAKAALDGLSGVLFTDDAQVVSLTVSKGYSASHYVGVQVDARSCPYPISSTTKRNPTKAAEEARIA